jgi:hypothetical protein
MRGRVREGTRQKENVLDICKDYQNTSPIIF